MSAMIHLLAGSQMKGKTAACLNAIAAKFAGLSERFWLCLAFLLFVAMGPFSIIAVIVGLYSLAHDTSNKDAHEPASL